MMVVIKQLSSLAIMMTLGYILYKAMPKTIIYFKHRNEVNLAKEEVVKHIVALSLLGISFIASIIMWTFVVFSEVSGLIVLLNFLIGVIVIINWVLHRSSSILNLQLATTSSGEDYIVPNIFLVEVGLKVERLIEEIDSLKKKQVINSVKHLANNYLPINLKVENLHGGDKVLLNVEDALQVLNKIVEEDKELKYEGAKLYSAKRDTNTSIIEEDIIKAFTYLENYKEFQFGEELTDITSFINKTLNSLNFYYGNIVDVLVAKEEHEGRLNKEAYLNIKFTKED